MNRFDSLRRKKMKLEGQTCLRDVETEVSPSNFIFAAKNIVCHPQFRTPPKMKFERLTFARESGGLGLRALPKRGISVRRSGAILAMTLVCLLVVGALGAMLVQSALREAQQSRQREQQLQTLWLVESGLDRGLARLAASSDYTGETWQIAADALGGRDAATVGIVVETIEENTAARRITVEAIYPDDPQHRIVQRRTIQVELLPTGEEP
jgi:hypothetical protein